MEKLADTTSTILYEQLAGEIAEKIEVGIFRPGDRLPSVRQTRHEKGYSPSTILQAYRLLEDRGLIEARPQSGYYVLGQPLADNPPIRPEISTPSLNPETIRMDELMDMVLHQSNQADMVQFGTALPAADLLPSNKLRKILIRLMRENDALWGNYVTPEGTLELRAQISRRLARINVSVSPDELFITNGCMEAIHLALRAACRPGDLVAVESPTYFGLLQALEAEGLRAMEIPTHHRDGISLDALEFALEHHPIRAVVVIPNFQNPLGSCMPEKNKRALVDLLARYETPLIEDDIYGELAFSEKRPSMAKAYDQQGLVLSCSSFSKDIGPSLRVGWIAPGRFAHRVNQLKMTSNIGPSFLPQLAIAEYLENGGYDNYLRGIRRAYQQKITQMARCVLESFPPDTRVTSPQGGFVLWVQMPETVNSLELFKQASQSNITIAPGYLFSATSKYHNYIRLNAAYMNFSGERAVHRLGEWAHQLAAQINLS